MPHTTSTHHHGYAQWLLAVAVLVGGILVFTSAQKVPTWLKSPSPTPLPMTSRYLTSSQTGHTAAYDVSLTGVTEDATPDPAFTLETGYTFLIFDITVTNRSAGTLDFVPVNQLYVRDNQGDTFTMHPASKLTKPIAATKLEPGQSATGQVSFAIPKKLARPLLYVDPQWDDLAPIVFDVLH